MSMCRVVSCVVAGGCLLWPMCSLEKTLLAFSLLHFLPQGQTYLLLQVSPNFLLLDSSPLGWKGHFFFLRFVINICHPQEANFEIFWEIVCYGNTKSLLITLVLSLKNYGECRNSPFRGSSIRFFLRILQMQLVCFEYLF